MTRHRALLLFFFASALAGCGPATPEAKVRARASLEFHCSEEEIQTKPLEGGTRQRIEASGCGREAVYVNAAPAGGDNWVLDSPNRVE